MVFHQSFLGEGGRRKMGKPEKKKVKKRKPKKEEE
jgi:hypothetical protein